MKWLRENLFAGWVSTLFTVLVLLFLFRVLPPFIDWAFLDAVWQP